MFTGTLRENILFGEKFDQAWYDRVLDACSLDEVISANICGSGPHAHSLQELNTCTCILHV